MAKLFKAKPSTQEMQPKASKMKKWGGRLKKVFKKADKDIICTVHNAGIKGRQDSNQEATIGAVSTHTQHTISKSNNSNNSLQTSIVGCLPPIPESDLENHSDEIVAGGQQTNLEIKGGSPTNYLPASAMSNFEDFASEPSNSNTTDHGELNPYKFPRYPAQKFRGQQRSTRDLNGKAGSSVTADESKDGNSILAKSHGDVEGAGPESSSEEDEGIAKYSEASDSGSADSTKGSVPGAESSIPSVFSSIPVAAPIPEWEVPQRHKRRSAPEALSLGHDRTGSDSTLVNFPFGQSTFPSPLSSTFLAIRPSAPHRLDEVDTIHESSHLALMEQLESRDHGRENKMLAIFKDAIAKVKAVKDMEWAKNVEKAIRDTKKDCDQGWEAAIEAVESNFRVDLEELNDDHADVIRELNENHEGAIRRVEKKHTREMNRIEKEAQKAQSEHETIKKALVDLKAEKEDLASQLNLSKENFEKFLGQIQTMAATRNLHKLQGVSTRESKMKAHGPAIQNQQNRQEGPSVISVIHNAMQPEYIKRNSYIAQASSSQDDMEARFSRKEEEMAYLLRQKDEEIARWQNDFYGCHERMMHFQDGMIRYQTVLEDHPGKTAHIDLHLQRKDEQVKQMRAQMIEYSETLEKEKQERKAENEAFSDKIDSVTEHWRGVDARERYLNKCLEEMWEVHETLLRQASSGLALNAYDISMASQLGRIKTENKELGYKVDGLHIRLREMNDEIYRLRTEKREVLAAKPQPQNDDTVRLLQQQVAGLLTDKEDLMIEVDIARQDQASQEPKCWREHRDQVLKGKEEEIADLKAQFEVRIADEETEDEGDLKDLEDGQNEGDLFESYEAQQSGGPLFGTFEVDRHPFEDVKAEI